MIRKKNQSIQILFDGQPARLEPGRQMFRLMVAIVEQVQRGETGKLDIAALMANDTIWENPQPNEDYVRAQLRLLRSRHLKGALNMRGTLALRAEVNDVSEP